MAEKNLTSSMTSVTEEETSASSESDTTESYPNRTSSVLSSSDYNTDDKLTPGLNKIKISKPHVQTQSRKDETESVTSISISSQESSSPLQNKNVDGSSTETQAKEDNNLLKLAVSHHRRSRGMKRLFTSIEQDNLGIEDPENKLSTDFSDTSSKVESNNSQSDKSSQEKVTEASESDNRDSSDRNNRPFLPDLQSDRWYEAKCFDSYWANYHFVMEWYRQHIKAVHMLSGSLNSTPVQGQHRHSSKSKRAKRSERARKRRQAKQRKANLANSASQTDGSSSACTQTTDEQEDIEMEMPITEELMAFLTKSLKHRLERDNEKTNQASKEPDADMLNTEQVSTSQGPSTEAPKEQPGVRRTAEMKSLYGAGAAMIHGMETALQMTFDRITDRKQPKLWPNMPLNVVFD